MPLAAAEWQAAGRHGASSSTFVSRCRAALRGGRVAVLLAVTCSHLAAALPVTHSAGAAALEAGGLPGIGCDDGAAARLLGGGDTAAAGSESSDERSGGGIHASAALAAVRWLQRDCGGLEQRLQGGAEQQARATPVAVHAAADVAAEPRPPEQGLPASAVGKGLLPGGAPWPEASSSESQWLSGSPRRGDESGGTGGPTEATSPAPAPAAAPAPPAAPAAAPAPPGAPAAAPAPPAVQAPQATAAAVAATLNSSAAVRALPDPGSRKSEEEAMRKLYKIFGNMSTAVKVLTRITNNYTEVVRYLGNVTGEDISKIIVTDADSLRWPSRRGNNQAPFARKEARTNITEHLGNTTRVHTVVRVHVRHSRHIFSVYLLMFLPVGVLWFLYLQTGRYNEEYMRLLGITLCVFLVGFDMINQSLAVVTDAPCKLSMFQSGGMAAMTGIYNVVVRSLGVEDRPVEPLRLSQWCLVALAFAAYQMVNHWVSEYCSLSERTIFLNMSPLLAFLLERCFMPDSLRPAASVRMQLALICMPAGALLFSLQSPDFTALGAALATLLVVVQVPYRLLQRLFLGTAVTMALPVLAFVDGVVLFVIAGASGYAVEEPNPWMLARVPSVGAMLAISVAMMLGNHMCSLAQLRVGAATMFLVFTNLAAIVDMFVGIVEFHDKDFTTPLACAGLFISVASGIWYTTEVLWIKPDANPLAAAIPWSSGGSDQ